MQFSLVKHLSQSYIMYYVVTIKIYYILAYMYYVVTIDMYLFYAVIVHCISDHRKLTSYHNIMWFLWIFQTSRRTGATIIHRYYSRLATVIAVEFVVHSNDFLEVALGLWSSLYNQLATCRMSSVIEFINYKLIKIIHS